MNFKNRPYLEVKIVKNGKIGHRENIKKTKVPFYCFFSEDGLTKKLGLVNQHDDWYYLIDLTKQRKKGKEVAEDLDLEELIKEYNIDTTKVKLIVFE